MTARKIHGHRSCKLNARNFAAMKLLSSGTFQTDLRMKYTELAELQLLLRCSH